MATNTKAAKATPASFTGAHRANGPWLAALTACQGLGGKGAATPWAAAVQLASHLGYRAPNGKVAWVAGTTSTVPQTAQALGVKPGMPVAQAMAIALAAMGKAATTPQQHAACAALVAATPPPAKQ